MLPKFLAGCPLYIKFCSFNFERVLELSVKGNNPPGMLLGLIPRSFISLSVLGAIIKIYLVLFWSTRSH